MNTLAWLKSKERKQIGSDMCIAVVRTYATKDHVNYTLKSARPTYKNIDSLDVNCTKVCNVTSTWLGLDDNGKDVYDTHYSVNGKYLSVEEVARMIDQEINKYRE